MITNFFTRKRRTNPELNSSTANAEENIEPLEPKKSKKRSTLTGFPKKDTPSRIKNMEKYKPAGDWRKVTQIKINYTYLAKQWSYGDLQCKEEFIVPFGMLKIIEKLYSHNKCYNSFNVLSDFVRKELALTAENYDKEKMKLLVSHQGNRGIKSFYYIYCQVCHKDKLPVLLNKYKEKLPESPKITIF